VNVQSIDPGSIPHGCRFEIFLKKVDFGASPAYSFKRKAEVESQ
jgi:hypothetical protein